MENRDGNEVMDMEDTELPFDQNPAAHPENYYVTPEYPPLGSVEHYEWSYYARRTSQEILPGLYLGPYASATRAAKEEMLKMQLTHVVCVRSAAEAAFIRPNHIDAFKYLTIELDDSLFEGIIPKLKLVINFLDECFKSGGRALVHGNGGMCRSAAMVIGYIMWTHGVDAKTAFTFVQDKRFCIVLNDAFMKQLRDFEMMVKAVHVVPSNPGENPNKRAIEEEDEVQTAGKVCAPTSPRQ